MLNLCCFLSNGNYLISCILSWTNNTPVLGNVYIIPYQDSVVSLSVPRSFHSSITLIFSKPWVSSVLLDFGKKLHILGKWCTSIIVTLNCLIMEFEPFILRRKNVHPSQPFLMGLNSAVLCWMYMNVGRKINVQWCMPKVMTINLMMASLSFN